VLVISEGVPGDKDNKVSNDKDTMRVTLTPTKIENGVLKGPVSTNPDDPNVKVTLWESNPMIEGIPAL
jgi:hypothetical protein